MNHDMPPPLCLNCQAALHQGENFCPACGQTTKTHRLSLTHFFHESFHAVTHADKGILHLLKCLAVRPGTTAREYLEGRRKAYFNPFTFFLIAMGVFVFLNVYFSPPHKPIQPDERVLEQISSQDVKRQYLARMDRAGQVQRFTRNNGNIMAMIAIPFISVLTWLFFRRQHFNYAEHLTANMMFITFGNLFFAVLIFPLQAATRGTVAASFLSAGGLLLQGVYLGWSLNGFLGLRSRASRLKSFGVSFLAILLWAVFTILFMAIYIYQGSDFYKFFTRMSR